MSPEEVHFAARLKAGTLVWLMFQWWNGHMASLWHHYHISHPHHFGWDESEGGWCCCMLKQKKQKSTKPMPLVVETKSNWGGEVKPCRQTFTLLATCLALGSLSHKAKVISDNYGMNVTLVRAITVTTLARNVFTRLCIPVIVSLKSFRTV